MAILNLFVNDMFERIATEASKLAAYSKKSTISSREIQTAISEGTKSVTNPFSRVPGIDLSLLFCISVVIRSRRRDRINGFPAVWFLVTVDLNANRTLLEPEPPVPFRVHLHCSN